MEIKGGILGQGNTAEIYEWETDKILKIYRKGIPDTLCEGEFSVTENVYNLLKNTPKPIEVVRIDGRIGGVYERIQGRTMLKEIVSKPWTFRKYSRMLAQYHINIQKPINFNLPTVKDKLRWNIGSTTLLSDIEKQRICQYIDSLPDGNILCHFDFYPDNIMLPRGRNIIIDWMTACKGDGLSDVARTCVILEFSEIPGVPRFMNRILGIIKKEMYNSYLKEYLKISGARIQEIKAWELPIAAARLCEWRPEKENQILLDFIRRNIDQAPEFTAI